MKGTYIVSPGVAVNPFETASTRAPATRPTEMVGPSKFEGMKRLCVRIVPRPTGLFVPASASGTARSVTVISRLSRDSRSPRDQMAVRDGRAGGGGGGGA